MSNRIRYRCTHVKKVSEENTNYSGTRPCKNKGLRTQPRGDGGPRVCKEHQKGKMA